MDDDKQVLRRFEVKRAIMSSPAWETLRGVIQTVEHDRSLIDDLVKDIAESIEKSSEFYYTKRTFQVRDDLLEEMQVYCVRHGITQKTFINLAISMLLDVNK